MQLSMCDDLSQNPSIIDILERINANCLYDFGWLYFHRFSTSRSTVVFTTAFTGLPFGSLKGGDPAAPSGTATLLRLHPSHWSYLRRLPPCGWCTDFGYYQLPWRDGRCVQGPGTHSPRHADSGLLATPTSCGRVAAHNPNWDYLFEIRLLLRDCSSL